MATKRVAVIGAGVVGLAVAHALATRGNEVWLFEKHARVGAETSSRNSEVLHAGLYYPPGSLKARLCVEGRERLVAFCQREGVAWRNTGKLIVATADDERAELDALASRAAENGAVPLQPWTGPEIRRRWPALHAAAGLFSPATGIIDAHGLMTRLRLRGEQRGVRLLLRHEVTAAEQRSAGWRLTVQQPDKAVTTLDADAVVNAAGLWADAVAELPGVDHTLPRQRFVKGCYFQVQGAPPADTLVYPVPSPSLAGLGTHLTLDLAGQARLGPDVAPAADRLDYAVDAARVDAFLLAAQRFWPALTRDRLVPGYAGIRPKLDAAQPADFLVREGSDHGRPGWVDLLGIESPGLTASLALGAHVAALLA